MTPQEENRLKILRADLADTNNPKILERYPHLDNEELRQELRSRIKKLEAMR